MIQKTITKGLGILQRGWRNSLPRMSRLSYMPVCTEISRLLDPTRERSPMFIRDFVWRGVLLLVRNSWGGLFSGKCWRGKVCWKYHPESWPFEGCFYVSGLVSVCSSLKKYPTRYQDGYLKRRSRWVRRGLADILSWVFTGSPWRSKVIGVKNLFPALSRWENIW